MKCPYAITPPLFIPSVCEIGFISILREPLIFILELFFACSKAVSLSQGIASFCACTVTVLFSCAFTSVDIKKIKR